MSDQTPSTLRSPPHSSSLFVFTPSSTESTPGEQQSASTPVFSFRASSQPRQTSRPASSSTSSGTPRFTPSSTPFTFVEERSWAPFFTHGSGGDGVHDPDRPLPSVERRILPVRSRQRSPGTTVYMPSTSTNPGSSSVRQAPERDSVLQNIGGLRSLGISSPRVSSSDRSSTGMAVYPPSASTNTNSDSARQVSNQDVSLHLMSGALCDLGSASSRTPGTFSSHRHARTPSINISPVAASSGSDLPPAASSRAESFVDGVAALRIGSLGVDSPETSGLRESRSPSPSRRRRRSGSGVNRGNPHKVEDEEPPHALFYKPEVQEALSSAKGLTSRMADVLSSSNLHRENGSSVQSIHRQALKLNDFQLPSSRVVGLVGDSGAGKSLLVNSLLHKGKLAISGGSGNACTCAVTEYIFHDRDDFILHVDYFSLDELEKQFEELLKAYRDYELLSKNPRDRDENESDKSLRELLEKKAKLAKATFRASFKERLEREPTVLSSMDFEPAVRMMVEWASELLSGQGGQEEFDTVERCSSRLRELSSESDDSLSNRTSRTLWPFIQKLRVYLNAYILSKGLILADLPGLRDLNSARKGITERYIRQCHQILVVARIDRVMTDMGVKEIFSLANRANLSQIDVVCTRAEEIQTSEARDGYPDERATIDDLQKTIDNDTEKIDSLKEDIGGYGEGFSTLTREEARELLELQQDCRRAEEKREADELKLLRYIIKLRNDKVTHGLREEYGNQPSDTKLQVFCVSNKLYRENWEKPATTALPFLELSGIIELRRHCIGIVAESRLRATRAFIMEDIPAFLGSVELWVEVGAGNASAERKQRILDAATNIQRKLNELTSLFSPVNRVSRNLIQEFKNEINQRMKQSEPQWAIHSGQASREWRPWHHLTYSAFVSKYGDYSTLKEGYHCWNKEAMEAMNDDMSPLWRSFVLDLEAHLERIDIAVVQAFSNARGIALSACENDTRGAASNSRSAMRTLASTLLHREERILDGLEEESENFNSELSSFHTDAFSSIRTAFIGKLMETTYHAASMKSGSGSDRRKKDLITDKFSSPRLFHDHRRNCKQRFRDIANEMQEKVSQVVNEQVGLVEADLRVLRGENVLLESERDPEFRRRVEDEVERVRGEVDRIGQVVGEVS